ncbi:hypothetical protein ACL02S_05700 [Nocardia sp. 004]|uniref:hypothetical protein n=1 Tax=Nocardia sp. 004 TaxID=3385978 RepID=UPI0039A3B4A1
MPDILAMATNGHPAPGRKLTLPSGAVWAGGATSGTSVITVPGAEATEFAADTAANEITGGAGRIDSLARTFHEILSAVPTFVASWISGTVARDAERAKTGISTRIVKVTSRTTITNPAGSPTDHGAGDVIEQLPDDAAVVGDSGIDDRTPIHRAAGGKVSGPGGSREDAIPAWLSNGEYVVNAAATSNTLPLLEAINAGWVPSPAYLSGMVAGFADGGLVGDAASAERWRDLLADNLQVPSKPATEGFRPQDFGLFGWAADALGTLGNFAADAGGAAGAAVGSAVAPLFAPNGLLGTMLGGSYTASTEPTATQRRTSDVGAAPDPLTASLRIEPKGIPQGPAGQGVFTTPMGTLADLPAGTQSAGLTQMGALADAFGRGLEGAAMAAGSRVGAALGAAIGPALGPAGVLAPEIGAELGSLIGSRFGGSLRASMTVSGQTGPNPAIMSKDGTAGTELVPGVGLGGNPAEESFAPSQVDAGGVGGGGGSVGGGVGGSSQPSSSGSANGGTGGGEWKYEPDAIEGVTSGPSWVHTPPGSKASIAYPADPNGPLVVPDVRGGLSVQDIVNDLRKHPKLSIGETGDAAVPAGEADEAAAPDTAVPDTATPDIAVPAVDGLETDTPENPVKYYNQYEGNFNDLSKLAGQKVGSDFGNTVDAMLGGGQSLFGGKEGIFGTLGARFGDAIGTAYEDADPDNNWLHTIGTMVGNATGIPWTPLDQQPPPPPTFEQQLGMVALQSGISGLQQGGLVGGITGAVRGVGSALGSTAGRTLGTLAAPFLGPAGALAPFIGEMIGSVVGSSAADFLTKPIELAAGAAKEEIGSGFGLVDLAKGQGGRTARGDIYNFNGMDPKSAAIAVERVRRRRTVAQQRGGGLGR